ncbi:sialidase family protein [Microbacterium sp. NPDC087591]|uniref:sialidase family protein n=1 Tax=Microbacterium sp. NPDC087591 TaxID=3364192 RepID=UPI00381BB990
MSRSVRSVAAVVAALLAVVLLPAPAAVAASQVDLPIQPDVEIVSPENSDCLPWDMTKSREDNEVVDCGWFPSVARLADGRLLIAYSDSPSHSNYSRIAMRTSDDEGRTWSSATTIVDTPGVPDEKEPNVTVLRNGDVLLWYYDFNNPHRPNNRTINLIRSTDDGATWSSPLVPATVAYTSPYGYAAGNGELIELDNGDLLLPFTAMRDRRGREGAPAAHVLRSFDGGASWDIADERTVMWSGPDYYVPGTTTPATWYVEPALVDLGAGEIMMVARTSYNPQDAVMRVSYSSDYGDTWTSPVDIPGLKGDAPHLLRLRDGNVLLTWGDRSRAWGQGRPTAGLIYDPAHGWAGAEQTLIYRGPRDFGDQAYSGSVQLADGGVLTVYYDRMAGTIGGTFLDLDAEGIPLGALVADGDATITTTMNHTAAGFSPSGPVDGVVDYGTMAVANTSVNTHGTPHVWQADFSEPLRVGEIGVALKPGYRESAVVEVATGAGSAQVWTQVRDYQEARVDALDWFGVGHDLNATGIRVTITASEGWAGLAGVALRAPATGFDRRAPGQDTVAPYVQLSPVEPASGWFSSVPAQIVLTAHDRHDSAPTVEVDTGSGWQPGTTSVAVDTSGYAEGLNSFVYRTRDDALNTSTVRMVSVNVDRTAPTASAALAATGDPATRRLTITGSDALSGVKTIGYLLSGASSWVTTTLPTPLGVSSVSVDVPVGTTVQYRVYDTARNTTGIVSVAITP